MKLLIQNGRVLDPVSKTVTLTDLLAENGRVALLERGLETEADRIIDASGLVVSPGLVDMHVHLRDPGGMPGHHCQLFSVLYAPAVRPRSSFSAPLPQTGACRISIPALL